MRVIGHAAVAQGRFADRCSAGTTKGTGSVKIHRYITVSLWVGAGLLVVLAVAGTLWVMLAALGDDAGAQACLGTGLVVAVCFVLDLVTLVVLLAIAQLSSKEQPESERDESGVSGDEN